MQQWSSKVGNRVWVMGDAVVDLIPEGELHYLKCPGGAPANVAVGVARLDGAAVTMVRGGNTNQPARQCCFAGGGEAFRIRSPRATPANSAGELSVMALTRS